MDVNDKIMKPNEKVDNNLESQGHLHYKTMLTCCLKFASQTQNLKPN